MFNSILLSHSFAQMCANNYTYAHVAVHIYRVFCEVVDILNSL